MASLPRAKVPGFLGLLLATAAHGLAAAPAPPPEAGPVSLAWIGNSVAPSIPAGAEAGLPPPSDLWVDRDGTSYAISPGGAGGATLVAFRQGARIAEYPASDGFVVAGNRTHLFIGSRHGVRIIPKDPHAADRNGQWLFSVPAADRNPPPVLMEDGIGIRGLLANDHSLFVSHAAFARIEQWDLRSRRKVREWPFARPAALAFDPWEGLWVVRERELAPGFDARTRNFRKPLGPDVLQPAGILRLRLSDGKVLETLSGAEIPVALAVQIRAEGDYPALLVADNGELQQLIRFSRRNPARSTPLRPFGNRYGMLGMGTNEGFSQRFNGMTGLGVAIDGSITLAQNWNLACERRGDIAAPCAEILSFSPDGTLQHAVRSLFQGQPACLMPEPSHDVFYRPVRLTVDWNHPGQGWELSGRTTNPLLFPADERHRKTRHHPVIRSVLGQTWLYEQDGDTLLLYRRNPERYGDVWSPAGAFRPGSDAKVAWPPRLTLPRRLEAAVLEEGDPEVRDARTDADRLARQKALNDRASLVKSFGWIWMDGRGSESMDGQLQDDEVLSLGARFDQPVWSVDSQGTAWLCARETGRYARTSAPQFTAWTPTRLDMKWVPIFQRQPNQPVPPQFANGEVAWHRYLPTESRMLIAGSTAFFPGTGPQLLCVFGDWTVANGQAPHSRPSHQVILRELVHESGTASQIVSIEVARNWIFCLRVNPVRIDIHDLYVGNRVATLRPEASPPVPSEALRGAHLSATDRAEDGVSLVASAPGWRNLLAVHWRPGLGSIAAPDVAPVLTGHAYSKHNSLQWETPPCGLIEGYNLYRSGPNAEEREIRLNETPLRIASIHDADVVNGLPYAYTVRIVNAHGEGPPSAPFELVANQPVARFVGEDRETQGNWRGRYGTQGHILFGDLCGPAEADNPHEPEGVSGPSPDLGRDRPLDSPDIRPDPALPQRSGAGREDERVAGVLAVPQTGLVTFPLAIRNGRSLRTSLYCGSSERIHGVRVEILDPDTHGVLDTREFSNETETSVRGRYLTWDVTGTVLFRLSAPTRGPIPDQCGINAVFFDEATSRPLSPRRP